MLLKEKLEIKKCINDTINYGMKVFNIDSNIIIIGEKLNITSHNIEQVSEVLYNIGKNIAGLLGNNTYNKIVYLENQPPIYYKDIIVFVIANNNEILVMDKDENLILNIYLNKYTTVSIYNDLINLSKSLLLEFI